MGAYRLQGVGIGQGDRGSSTVLLQHSICIHYIYIQYTCIYIQYTYTIPYNIQHITQIHV